MKVPKPLSALCGAAVLCLSLLLAGGGYRLITKFDLGAPRAEKSIGTTALSILPRGACTSLTTPRSRLWKRTPAKSSGVSPT